MFSIDIFFNKIKIILVLCLVLIVNLSCDKSKEVYKSEQEAKKAVFFIHNSTGLPISLTAPETLIKGGKNQIKSFNEYDTISVDLKMVKMLFIDTPKSFQDTILVVAGDSVSIDLTERGLKVSGKMRYLFDDISSLQNQGWNNSDSLYRMFFISDESKAIEASNDYSIVKLIPVTFNTDLYKNKPELLEVLIEDELSKLNETPITSIEKANDYPHSLQKILFEIRRKKAFFRLIGLYGHTKKNDLLEEIFSSPIFSKEELESSIYGEEYLLQYIALMVLEGKRDYSRSRLYVDYKKAFDLAPEFFSGELLKYTRELCLNQMVEFNENYNSVTSSLDKYINTYNDTFFIEKFKKSFMYDYNKLVNFTIDLNLITDDGSHSNLTHLLNSNKGKLIYIDYWASWCSPCRAAMPASRALRKAYQDKDVVFVYFSTDTDQLKWKNAARTDSIITYKNSYLVLNHQSSDFTKHLEIDYIPRYLLFDKLGNLVDNNAPGPASDDLKELLDKFLAIQE
tara:strand:- start:3979 stop:5508 length:1530 start_codon:yes stop_codon:yes gene_type:complete